MKKLTNHFRVLIAIAIMLSVAMPTIAHDFEVDGIYYNYLDESDKTVEVTYRGSSYDSYTNEYSSSVTIPSSVTYSGTTYSVAAIDFGAFVECSGLTSITIPNSVTEIGIYAFKGCTGLTSVTIPNSVTSIGIEAFKGCTGLTSVTIPNSVTSIDFGAFDFCSSLTSVTIPNSVILIGDWAFAHCYGLTSVTIPNSVTKIGSCAFHSCTGLTSVTIPNSVTSIGSFAFCDCHQLESVTIPNSVTSIGNYAFEYCYDLTEVTIGNSVTSIGDSAFGYCYGLTEVTIPNSVTSIGNEAFSRCSGLNSVTIGNSVETIGENVFNYCYNLDIIVSLNTAPPICASSESFDSKKYSNATLYVPKDSFAKYFIDKVWGLFSNINKIETLASSIKLNNSSIELVKGATTTLSATISPSNATIKDIVWKSNNPQVATVNQRGKVTALSVGTATITATANDGSDISASCNVVVNNTKITLSQTEVSIPVNDIMTLTYTPSLVSVEWSTSNANVAYIKNNSDGSVTVVGMADGEAIVTAKATDGSGASASCKVIVGIGGIEGVEADNNNIEIARYDIHGRKLAEPTKGINIIKMSDGSTRKEFVK